MKKSVDFGQFWYSMFYSDSSFLKISWILRFCVGASSLGTIFWVSGSKFSIWGTSWGPHHGCVNATKLEIVSVFFFGCFWWGYWSGSWPEDKFSGQIFEPRLEVGWTKAKNEPKLWKGEPGLSTKFPIFACDKKRICFCQFSVVQNFGWNFWLLKH